MSEKRTQLAGTIWRANLPSTRLLFCIGVKSEPNWSGGGFTDYAIMRTEPYRNGNRHILRADALKREVASCKYQVELDYLSKHYTQILDIKPSRLEEMNERA